MVRKHAPYWKYSVFWRSGGEQFLWSTAAAILNHHNNYLILPLLDHKSHILERRAGKGHRSIAIFQVRFSPGHYWSPALCPLSVVASPHEMESNENINWRSFFFSGQR
jgi:hypothetical protein